MILGHEQIQFKQSFSPSATWINYILALLAVLVLVFYFAKKYQRPVSSRGDFFVVKSKRLNAKTTLHLIEFQQQQFLLADNQQTLCLHPISPRTN